MMDIHSLAKVIWDYHHMNHKLEKSDCILVLGSHDTRTAEWGAKIYLEGWAPRIVFSGHLGRLTSSMWSRSEAEIFAEIAIKLGVPKERIFIEDKSTNTGENILLARELLRNADIHPKKIIAVHKPYMERRTYATIKKVWPEVQAVITSPPLSFEDYLTDEMTRDKVISIMVGDLHRIRLYPQKGYQIEQDIPKDVWMAFECLVDLGYTSHLIPQE